VPKSGRARHNGGPQGQKSGRAAGRPAQCLPPPMGTFLGIVTQL